MKKIILKTLVVAGLLSLILGGSSMAEEAVDAKILRLSAINAGYTDGDKVGQNYDFIELTKTDESQVALDRYKINYFNSAGKLAGEISFTEQQKMIGDRLVLGSKYSPQYKDSAENTYLYSFGSTGLASTAGRLTLTYENVVVDEVCWGKLECETESYEKFSSEMSMNQSLLLDWQDGRRIARYEKYYPVLDSAVIVEMAMEIMEAAVGPRCDGLIFSEIYAYFENDYSEQFVEIFNDSTDSIDLAQCKVLYKNKSYAMTGALESQGYFVYQNPELRLSKDPSSFNSLGLVDSDGEIVDEAVYYNGQRKASSYAWMGGEIWKQTYALTPGAENIYQQYKSCPEGKVINPNTGHCVKEEDEGSAASECPEGKYRNPETGRCKAYETSSATLTPCKEGYYRNPETNRCKKIASTEEMGKAACKDGYERNPETGRCRKIRANEGADYPVQEQSYSNSSTFLAYGALLLALVAGGVYILFQFRKEIGLKLRKIYRKLSKNWLILQKLPILVKNVRQKFSERGRRVQQKIKRYGKSKKNYRD